MEATAATVRAYNRKCIGCIRQGADVMISFQTLPEAMVNDLFLRQSQAKALLAELRLAIEDNDKEMA